MRLLKDYLSKPITRLVQSISGQYFQFFLKQEQSNNNLQGPGFLHILENIILFRQQYYYYLYFYQILIIIDYLVAKIKTQAEINIYQYLKKLLQIDDQEK
ncbi:hypothetical protein pb186bvf_000056 [Paramecium bursaria]